MGSTRSVTCNIGFRIEGSQVIVCQSNGQWTTPGNCTNLVIEQQYEEETFLFPKVCGPRVTPRLQSYLVQFRVLGGRNVTPGEMPWMLKLDFYKDGAPAMCGGFLINWKWALTAAHCLEGVDKITVSAGRVDYSVGSPAEVVLNVTSDHFYIHPQYNFQRYMNDIALFELPRSLRRKSSVNPICILANNDCEQLPKINSDDENYCGMVFAAGWGITLSQRESKVLRKINMTVIGPRLCDRSLGNVTIDRASQICAIGERIDTIHGPMYEDACRGDSGGPLTCNINGSMAAVGIVSFGRGCGTGTPGVYTRICHFKDWIMETMGIRSCQVPSVDGGSFVNTLSWVPVTSGSSLKLGEEISLICDENFNPNSTSGNITVTCQQNRQWSSDVAKCFPHPTSSGQNVRLVDSTLGHHGEGFVLVKKHDGTWGTVCDNMFGYREAELVCKLLGFG